MLLKSWYTRDGVFVLFLVSYCNLQFLANSELISTGVAVGSAVAISGFFAGYEYFKCRYYECCNDQWIIGNVTGLRNSLRTHLYGQHLVIDTVVPALKGHLNNKNPKKALTFSFHGWTGGGKNYVSKFIAENLYKKGTKSDFVHLFISSFHFPHGHLVDKYKDQLHSWITGNVTRCERSMFIFDELDKMTPGVLDAIKPYIESHEELHGVDYRKSIFIFLSNTGGNDITTRTLEYWKRGNLRESIQLPEMEEIINVAAFNEEGGLRFSSLISSHLVDHFVPFLPLERSHVKLCIKDYFRWRRPSPPTEEELNRVADTLQYFPKEKRIFSSSGCKRVAQKVELLLEEEEEEDEGVEMAPKDEL